MIRNLFHLVLIFLFGTVTHSSGQTTYHGRTVETKDLRVELQPIGEALFSINLTHKVTGLSESHEFGGLGTNDPEPFLLVHSRYCDTPVILLTIKFPWRHALPQFRRVLDTYAFRTTDLAFIEVATGPLTDIALADDTAYDPSETDMLPPIRVRCLLGNDEKPFEFF